MKKVLVIGASGATGRLLVEILLQKGVEVIAIVRNENALASISNSQPGLQIVETEITEISEADLAQHISKCEAVVSCLGHNLTFKGMFGHPRRLVTDTITKIVKTIESTGTENTIKIILMNTTGNSNRDIPEKPAYSQRVVIFLLRYLLPPHVDNEKAADYLRLQVGQDSSNIEWTAVRPDALVNQDQVSEYDVTVSPIRNAVFNSGATSRINVAEFMSELVVNSALWDDWKGKMPVIYNRAQSVKIS